MSPHPEADPNTNTNTTPNPNPSRPGPRTDEGKRASSANATAHGLTARRPLSDEEAERMRVIVDQWTVKCFPETPAEEALVASAAIEYVRYLRCVEIEEARLGPASKQALRDWKTARRHAVRCKGQRIHFDPEGNVAELLESAFGIDWLIRQWRGLLVLIDERTGWSGDHLTRAMHLLGHDATRPDDPSSLPGLLWANARSAFPFAWDRSAAPLGDPDAIARIRSLVADALAHLEALRPQVWEEVDLPQARVVETAALVDTSKDGQLRQRYRREAYRDFHRSLADLTRLRSERSKAHAREAKLMDASTPSSRRPEAPAHVPPPNPPQPPTADPRNESPQPPESSTPDRSNPYSQNEIRRNPAEASPSSEQRIEGRIDGRITPRLEADRTSPDPRPGRPSPPSTAPRPSDPGPGPGPGRPLS